MKLLLTIALIGYSLCHAAAGELSADVVIAVDVEPEGAIPSGTEGTISITLENLGPDTATVTFQWLAAADGTGFPPLAFPSPVVGPCLVSPVGQPGPGDNFGFWVTYELMPGESRTCSFEFLVLETELLSQTVRFVASVFFLGMPVSPDDDPDLSNNEAELQFVYSNLIVSRPVPLLSFSGLVLLVLVVTAAAYFSPGLSANSR